MGRLEANPTAPQSSQPAALLLVGWGRPWAGVAVVPQMLAGVRTGPGVQRGRGVPPCPSHHRVWQATKAQLCCSGALTWLCLGPSPGWDPSPWQRRQTPRQAVPPNPGSERRTRHSTAEGAGDALHAPSPRHPTALVPLQHPPTRNRTFTRPETLQHRAAWAGGLPSPAGDNPTAGTIIG